MITFILKMYNIICICFNNGKIIDFVKKILYNGKKRNEEIKMKKFIALLLVSIMCLSLVACDKAPEKDKDKETETNAPVVQTNGDVKITKDNFDTYFEFVEESFFTKDSSGKVNALRFRHYYKLKDEYSIDLEKSSIELKYDYSSSMKKVDIDFENEKFTLGEQIGEKKEVKNIVINVISQMTYKDYAILLLQPNHASKGDTKVEVLSDFNLLSVEGTIHLIESAEEHNHSAEPHSH